MHLGEVSLDVPQVYRLLLPLFSSHKLMITNGTLLGPVPLSDVLQGTYLRGSLCQQHAKESILSTQVHDMLEYKIYNYN